MRGAAAWGGTFHISPRRRHAFKIAVRGLYAEMFVWRQPIKKEKDTGYLIWIILIFILVGVGISGYKFLYKPKMEIQHNKEMVDYIKNMMPCYVTS